MHDGTHMPLREHRECLRDDTERLLGLGLELKFVELVAKLIQYVRDSVAVQSVTKQWDYKLEGEQYFQRIANIYFYRVDN